MKHGLLWELWYQIVALIIAVILVHLVYVTVVRPNAETIQVQQTFLQQTDESYVPDRSIYIVLKDYEQEACIIMFLWAISIIGLKTQRTIRERNLLEKQPSASR